jgi:hypothetical protein
MILMAQSILDEARNEAREMLRTGERIRPVKINEDDEDGPNSAAAVSRNHEDVIGGFPIELEGVTFYVGMRNQ